MDRRRFLERSALAASALAVPRTLWASPRTMRVTGRVHAGGRGVPGVRVSDGLAVVRTAADGTYTLVTDGTRPFVFISTPAGYRIPTQAMGTARFFQRLPATGDRADLSFELTRGPSDAQHAFLLLADPQTATRAETDLLHAQTVPDVLGTVQALGEQPVFGVACGDIMFDDLSLYPEYERAVQRMGVPFFQVVGNHDLDFSARTDEASTATFETHFGPRYYSFDRGDVRYVVLDSVFWTGGHYIGYVEADQLAWLEADLAGLERGAPVVVCLHIPLHSTAAERKGAARANANESVVNRDAVYRLLEPYRALVLAGHVHESEMVAEHGTEALVCGAVCGAWWSGPICYDGTPNGYTVVEVRGEALRWRYKSTGLAAAHQLRAYGRGADVRAPEEAVANVWNWDPAWSVVWLEDGVQRGRMARRTGLDPLSVQLHTGADKPEGRAWVDPMPTGHLFYAPLADVQGEVRVEARSRFGEAFSVVVPPPVVRG